MSAGIGSTVCVARSMVDVPWHDKVNHGSDERKLLDAKRGSSGEPYPSIGEKNFMRAVRAVIRAIILEMQGVWLTCEMSPWAI
jgi:hypothetical protein